MAKFLIADDHPLFREALSAALEPYFKGLTIIEAECAESTLNALADNGDVDVLLLDLYMPGSGDLYCLLRIREDFPNLPVAVISATESIDVISQVMNFGAKAFIPKSSATADIAEGIQAVLDGNTWLPDNIEGDLTKASDEQISVANRMAALTPKQHSVLKLLQSGLLNKQIAWELNITEATVKAHIGAIFRKLEVNTRTQAVLLAEKMQVD